MQNQAGYIIESLPDLYAGSQKHHVEGLVEILSFFDVKTDNDLSVKNLNPFAVTIHNSIIRGLPTLAPTFIEDIISATFLKTKKQYNQNKSFSYPFINDEFKDEIFRSLHLIDPRLSLKDLKKIIKFDDSEKQLKNRLVFDIIPLQIGDYFIQSLSINRSFENIFQNYGLKYVDAAKRINLASRKVDFSIQLPYSEDNQPIGLAIELEKKLLDDTPIIDIEQRDKLLNEIGWANLLYLKNFDLDDPQALQPLIEFSYQKYFENLRKNYERPLYKTSAGLESLQIALTPFEVARIQKIIIDYILAGLLDLDAKAWKIAVIERDIPGAFLAIQDLSKQFNNLYRLAGSKKTFPQIELDIFYTEEFENADLNILYQGHKDLVNNFDPQQDYDLVIDSSLLRYSDLDNMKIKTKAKNLAILRSCKYQRSSRKFLSTEPIKYKKFYEIDAKSKKNKTLESLQDNLMFFVKNIFRYYELEPEQLQVLSNLLSRQHTIANLPFTAEKTLIYQIAALLQSGLTLVITPLFTIQQDQIRKLKKYRIDTWSYINNSIYDIYSHIEQINAFLNANSLIIFSSAEAFHFDQFRKLSKELKLKNITFSLVVIDQIQNVSFWTSSFNFAYRSLKQNLDNFLPVNRDYTILGLTSAANYDTLTDIQILFQINGQNIITKYWDFNNLKFNIKYIGNNAQTIKESKLNHQQIELQKLDELTNNGKLDSNTLIYSFKAKKYYQELNSKIYDKELGFFDTKPQTSVFLSSRRLAAISYDNFQKFINHQLDILIGNRPVAFGLDKKDIRKLIITSLPTGTEEFIHLIERTGRDLQPGQIHLLLSKTKVQFEITKYVLSDYRISAAKQVFQTIYELHETLRLLQYLYSNLQKDITLTNQLFTQPELSSDFTLEQLLILRIKQDFDIWVYFELQPMIDPSMIYVYDYEENLGYIDLNRGTYENLASGNKKELAGQILGFLLYEIQSIVGNPRDILLLLKEPLKISEKTNIIKKLASIKQGEQTTITIDFYNNIPEKIVELFADSELDTNQIIQIFDQTANFNEFSAQIKKIVGSKALRLKQADLQQLYLQYRDMFSTYRIVYYLYVTGLVADYLIDFRNQHFVLILQKLSEEQYLNRIYKHISPFVTKERALEVFEKIPKFEGQNFAHKAVNYWIYFHHNIILENIYDSIQDFTQFLNTNHKDKNFDAKLHQYISTYPYAKYLTELQDKIEKQQQDWLKIIEYYINNIGFLKSNWKHLNKSAQIILDKQPSNFIARMLKGWTTLILSEDNDQLSRALDDIALGFNLWRMQTGTTIEQFIEKINLFYKSLENINYDLKTRVEGLFTIKITNTWLKEFNKKFIDIT